MKKVYAENHGSSIHSVRNELNKFLEDSGRAPKKEIINVQHFLDNQGCYTTIIVYDEVEVVRP